jgi:hypothetical protein
MPASFRFLGVPFADSLFNARLADSLATGFALSLRTASQARATYLTRALAGILRAAATRENDRSGIKGMRIDIPD